MTQVAKQFIINWITQPVFFSRTLLYIKIDQLTFFFAEYFIPLFFFTLKFDKQKKKTWSEYYIKLSEMFKNLTLQRA